MSASPSSETATSATSREPSFSGSEDPPHERRSALAHSPAPRRSAAAIAANCAAPVSRSDARANSPRQLPRSDRHRSATAFLQTAPSYEFLPQKFCQRSAKPKQDHADPPGSAGTSASRSNRSDRKTNSDVKKCTSFPRDPPQEAADRRGKFFRFQPLQRIRRNIRQDAFQSGKRGLRRHVAALCPVPTIALQG